MNPIDDPDVYRQTQLEQDAHVLVETLDDCSLQPVIANGKRSEDNKFMWNSLTEQTPPTPRYVLNSIARLMLYVGSKVFTKATRLSSEEDRGAILAAAIQHQLPEDIDLPMGLSRWVTQPKDDRPDIPLVMEFAATRLHFDGITKNEPKEQLVVVDDLISTGGTMNAQTHGIIEQTNHDIVGVVLVADKGYGGVERLQNTMGNLKGANDRIYDPEPKVVAQLDLSGPRSKVSELYLPDGDRLLHDIRRSIERQGRKFIDNKNQGLITEHLGRTKS